LQLQAHDISQSVTAGESIESVIESVNLNEKFNQILEDMKQRNTYDPSEDNSYKNLTKLLDDDSNQNGNEDIEMLQTDFVIPTDPFSKMEIINPVRNKNCQHLYDKEQFFKVFESRPRNRFASISFFIIMKLQLLYLVPSSALLLDVLIRRSPLMTLKTMLA